MLLPRVRRGNEQRPAASGPAVARGWGQSYGRGPLRLIHKIRQEVWVGGRTFVKGAHGAIAVVACVGPRIEHFSR